MEFRSNLTISVAICILPALVSLRAESVIVDFPGARVDATVLIQTALDGCEAGDEVRLGAGIYEISAQLTVANGVTLVGEGWERTVIRQTATTNRVVMIDGGARIERVTLTVNSPAFRSGRTYPEIGKDLAGVDFANRGCRRG